MSRIQVRRAAALCTLPLFLATMAAERSKHVHLVRTDPMADTTLSVAPRAIMLWFSAPIQVSVTTIQLSDPAGHAVALARPRLGESAGAPVIADITGMLGSGRQAVTWRAMARDGHVVHGTFSFTLATPPARSR